MTKRTLMRCAAIAASCFVGLGRSSSGDGAGGDGGGGGEGGGREQINAFEYAVPMDSDSPWPKFRRTAMQTGRSPVLPIDTGADPCVFQTGKGIFSTAVIDGDDNIATLGGSTLQSEEHNFGILVLDAETGVPVGLNYTERTAHVSESGAVQSVTLDLTDVAALPASLRVYLIVDAYPAAVDTLTPP